MPPFQSPNFTQVPNDFFDEYLPELNGSELKVLLAVIRGTFGYHRAEVEISTREMAEATGLSSLSTISEAAAHLEEIGLIEKITDGKKSLRWRAVVSDTKTVSQNKKTDTKSVSPVIQKVYQGDTENVSLSLLNKDKEKKYISDTILQYMGEMGYTLTGNTATLLMEWRKYHTDERIKQAIERYKGKGENYIDKVLIDWAANGYPKTTEEKISAAKQQAARYPVASNQPKNKPAPRSLD